MASQNCIHEKQCPKWELNSKWMSIHGIWEYMLGCDIPWKWKWKQKWMECKLIARRERRPSCIHLAFVMLLSLGLNERISKTKLNNSILFHSIWNEMEVFHGSSIYRHLKCWFETLCVLLSLVYFLVYFINCKLFQKHHHLKHPQNVSNTKPHTITPLNFGYEFGVLMHFLLVDAAEYVENVVVSVGRCIFMNSLKSMAFFYSLGSEFIYKDCCKKRHYPQLLTQFM